MGRERENGIPMTDQDRRAEDALRPGEEQPEMVKDWSSDYFPTSARPIFIGWTIVVLGVAALCASVYFLSDHPTDPVKAKKQEAIKERLNIDDDED